MRHGELISGALAFPLGELSVTSMKRRFPVFAVPLAALLVPLLGGAGAVYGAAPAAKKLSFNDHIQPILAENCYACHGTDPGSRKADLRLDRAEHAYRKRKEGEPAS